VVATEVQETAVPIEMVATTEIQGIMVLVDVAVIKVQKIMVLAIVFNRIKCG
jgi:hypothetical protein